jgi:hypothetical protein
MLGLQPELAPGKTPTDLGATAKDVSAMSSSSEIVESLSDGYISGRGLVERRVRFLADFFIAE